jgi:hypothetical protein
VRGGQEGERALGGARGREGGREGGRAGGRAPIKEIRDYDIIIVAL